MSFNKVMILGRLGKEPELKAIPSGIEVCNFTVATNEYWTDKSGQKQEKTEWHRVVVWGRMASHCNRFLRKGSQVLVEGKLQTRQWDAQDGSKRYMTEINASNVQFLDARQTTNQNAQPDAPNYDTNTNTNTNTNNNSNAGSSMGDNYQVSTDASFTENDIPF